MRNEVNDSDIPLYNANVQRWWCYISRRSFTTFCLLISFLFNLLSVWYLMGSSRHLGVHVDEIPFHEYATKFGRNSIPREET